MQVNELKIGTKIELEFFDGYGEKIVPNFASQLELAMDENTAILAAPIFEGNIYPVRLGWFFNAYFMYEEGLYRFRGRVNGRGSSEGIAHIRIVLTEEITKVQRRQFFRFECSVPIGYRIMDTLDDSPCSKEYIPAVTRDISGGGMAIKHKEQVRLNVLVECELELAGVGRVNFQGRVVRAVKRLEDLTYAYEMGVLYRKIDNRSREAIIRYIFKEQRKLREKGLI